MGSWNDFNDAQSNTNLIPKGTLAKVRLIAAETTGRVCYGIELNPAYVDVAVGRWQQFTGKDAVLFGSDETFNKIKTKDA